ncbi:MAG: alpha-glucosidase/alpha-galactosidase [Halanaerobiaceae bacterium]
MRYTNDKVEDLKIAYIGGGSKGWAWNLMSDLAIEEQLSGTVKLYDIDQEAAEANEIIGNKVTARDDVKGDWKYQAVNSLKEALQGADFIIISILPATFDEMESDVHEPEKYGIYQSVGDTVGPGGIIRGLRTIPMYIEIAENIKEYAPEAWVINYTNPMTLCIKTLYEIFPEIKAYGCCHEVFGTQELLIKMLEDMKGIEGATRDDIKVNILGINHFTWLDQAYYKGIDLISLYKDFVDKYYETGFTEGADDNWMNSYFASAERVKFDLFKRYGLIAAAGDRHLAEFVPGNWYLKDPETVKSWRFNLTPVSWRKKHKQELIEKSDRLVKGEEEFELNPSGEEGVKQMKALLGLSEMITNVNIPNQGQIENLPEGSIVETNAAFRNREVSPVYAGKVPLEVKQLMDPHVNNQELLIQAVMKEDLDLAFKAFLSDPLVIIEREKAERLFAAMVENTKEYIPWV